MGSTGMSPSVSEPRVSGRGSRLLPTSFVGREREIAELAGVLADVRLLTLVGAPGIGKTRLASEVSARLAKRYPDGVWLVELAPIADPSSTAQAVAAALGVPDPPQRSAEDAIVEKLATRGMLLVLDNCEHVAGAAAALVARLLVSCPSVRVLATSRAALGLSGEQVWRVPPLEVSPAVQLFEDRARLHSPLSPVAGRSAVVERICGRLDGLPLAIELVAALTRVLSPEEILERLHRALPLLRSGQRDVNPRQQTMEAAVDSSYQLLGPDERLLFDRLSVFAGGFDLAAVQAVVPEGDVLPGLVTLVDHSLVMVEPGVDGRTRYRLLEPLRQYAEARLAAGDHRDATRRRHAEHYLEVARRLDGELRTRQARDVLHRFEQDDGNFRAALDVARDQPDDLGLRLCTALARSWALRGRVSEGRAWIEQMLQVETTDERLRSSALSRASRLAWRQHDNAATRKLLEESLDIERELGDQLREARRLRSLAMVAMNENDLDQAQRLLEESISIFRAHGEQDGLALSLSFFALALHLAGQHDRATPYVDEAIQLSQASGSIQSTIYSLSSAVFGAVVTGDTTNLRACANEVAVLLRELGGLHEDPIWLGAAMALASAEGRYRTALRLAGAADAIARRDGLRFQEPFGQHMRPWLERAQAQVDPTEMARLTAEGARLTLDELIDEALATDDHTGAGSPLSRRESEVAELIARGLTNGEIAEHLVISKRTVETHVAHIKTKLGLARRIEIAAWVLEGRHPDDTT